MAEITAPVQGILNINNVQGNYVLVPLVFKTKVDDLPIDLVATYTTIRLEIKHSYNVNIEPFIVYDLENGLTISGADNNILSFELDETFWTSQIKNWVYDITFEDVAGKAFTLIKGKINNILTASSV
jgi:hypothetical protein